MISTFLIRMNVILILLEIHSRFVFIAGKSFTTRKARTGMEFLYQNNVSLRHFLHVQVFPSLCEHKLAYIRLHDQKTATVDITASVLQG